MEKRIDVTVGYKIVEDGKPTRYFGAMTEDGVCYKDLDAYKKNDGICYIPQTILDNSGLFEDVIEDDFPIKFKESDWSVEHSQDLIYTKKHILENVATFVTKENKRYRLPINVEFYEYLADDVFRNVTWETINTDLYVRWLDEEWEKWQSSK